MLDATAQVLREIPNGKYEVGSVSPLILERFPSPQLLGNLAVRAKTFRQRRQLGAWVVRSDRPAGSRFATHCTHGLVPHQSASTISEIKWFGFAGDDECHSSLDIDSTDRQVILGEYHHRLT